MPIQPQLQVGNISNAMSTSDQLNRSAPLEGSSNASQNEQYQGLQEGSHTEQKLRHASAHHLYMTSRRFFIGPIPEGWINGHRKSWYRSRLRFRNYTSQTLSFSVDPVTSHYTHLDLDQTETPAHVSDEEVAITLSNTNEEPPTEDESASDTQEGNEEPRGELRTLSHPTEETETIESLSSEGSSSAEDSDTTPRASAQVRIRDSYGIYGSADASSSYVTAREEITSSVDTCCTSSTVQSNISTPTLRPRSQRSQPLTFAGPSTTSPIEPSSSAVPSEADSTTHLLKSRPKNTKRLKSRASGVSRSTLDRQEPQNEDGSESEDLKRDGVIQRKITRKMARFNLDDNVMAKKQKLRSRIARTQGTISANRPRRRQVQDGEIIKAEKMLVSVEETLQDTLPEDYTENDSLKMETRTVDRWREFLVVCRKGSTDDAPFVLQMYRTRVIPDAQSPNNKSKPYHEVRLNHKDTKVNLYSALDKTIVIWHPCRNGTRIYVVRPKSSVHAAEWYTFIRQILGWRRPSELPINVPDLGVSLVFKNPFDQLEAQLGVKSDDNRHTTILSGAAAHERVAAVSIIKGCIEMLEGRPEWSEVLKTWSKTEKMGLAWKRYDRLEWIFGANEENMYGSIAMQSTHELELRPRYHYPTATKSAGSKEVEPPPIEGFLIRLTSQKGLHQRMNKMFFKRLYFYSQDHFLLFCRPAKACPPTPPRLAPVEGSSIPSARQIMEEMPISWDIEPYPVQDDEIVWLTNGNPEFIQRHDEEAYAQLQRNVHNIGEADGYIDLCKVRAVRNMQHGSSPADPNISEGPAVDFQPEPDDTRRDDGTTKEFEHDRTFELALENGLVIRLQAYNAATRDEWVKRLDALVKYWRTRCFDDAAELQAMRQRNLKLLEIDEEMESIMGQFAQKWEVKKAETSPHLHNMCALSGCRPIKMSGQLYRKPRRHATFAKCHVILTSGKLVIFRSTLRQRNGVEIPHIHQDHDATIDLSDCYIYSGLATEADLLYANQTFDSNNPGLRALPRVYLASDTFTSRDEDSAITFVIWQPLRKSYFRAEERGAEGKATRTLRHVSALGKHGRTIVFKARSRVEKDRWVLSISSEIDRLQQEKQEDIRIVSL